MSRNKKRILDAFVGGKINSYLAQKLQKAINEDTEDDLVSMAIDDATDATNFGVKDNFDYNIKYYLDNLLDDILQETFHVNLSQKEKNDLKIFLFNNRKNKELDIANLNDFRILVHKWLTKELDKKAYPNIGGGLYKTKTYDLPRWIDALEKIYQMVKKGFDETKACNLVIFDWDSREQYKFLQWKKFYEDGGSSMYNVKTANFPFSFPMDQERPTNTTPNLTTFKNKQEQEKQKALDKKKQMLSRIRSLRKLLSDFSDIAPPNSSKSSEILDSIYELEKKVLTLNSEAMVKSSIVKTANIIALDGFTKEAEQLYKIADEPGSPPEPAAAAGDTNAPDDIETQPKSSNTSIQAIIDKLEVVSKALKDRDLVRDLATIDIDLHKLGISAYFTEISDSQSKLIEGFGYASNKIESVLAKLRGSNGQVSVLEKTDEEKAKKLEQKEVGDATKSNNTSVPPPETAQPPAKTNEKANPQELMNKPIGEVKNNLPGS